MIAKQETTIQEALGAAAKFLVEVGVGSARLDSELLLAYVLRRDRAWILAHADDSLNQFQIADFESLISRRSERIPLVHLTGSREFYGMDFDITPAVLTPRAETEQMVEWAIETTPQSGRLIDIGTGSGAIAIATEAHRPDLQIMATEVSPEALAIARTNAKKHASQHIEFVKSDLWAAVVDLAGAPKQFDTIVTNLPYLQDDADLMPEVRREPAVALFGGPDGLDLYRRFLHDLPAHLALGGHLYTECDPWQHEALIAEAAKAGLKPGRQSYFILEFIRR